jgi:short-subunit dehydrogenase
MSWPDPGAALITGASAGIGAEFARQLARQGFSLVLVARRTDRLEELADELRRAHAPRVSVLAADLSKPSESRRVVDHISYLDDLDVLVNNAGFGIIDGFLQADPQNHADMISVHCTAPVQLCHAALPRMRARGRGAIINVSSVAALTRSTMSAIYSSTKEFINVFSQLLQASEKRKGIDIRIQSLCPGFTYTEFHEVERMSGFDRSWFPEEWWMTAEEVVSSSLQALQRDAVVVIPGEVNRQHVDDYLSSCPCSRTVSAS